MPFIISKTNVLRVAKNGAGFQDSGFKSSDNSAVSLPIRRDYRCHWPAATLMDVESAPCVFQRAPCSSPVSVSSWQKMSMENRKRTGGSSNAGSLPHCSLSFLRQPARVLIIEKLLPYWSETSKVICDALDNFLSLACSLDGPTRIPMLSLFTISRQQECLLPFVHLRGNLARLRSCVEELRAISGDGCFRGAARGGELLQQAVLDSLQQFKQYMRHSSSTTKQTRNNSIFLEVTIVTSQPGRHLVRQLEMGLKDADLVSLKRLLVVQICHAGDWAQDSPSPEAPDAVSEDCLMLGTEVDLLKVENNVFAMEMMLKAWLQEQGGDQEHLHLLLPSPADNPTPVCVKCDMQERLISPVLTPLHPPLGAKTESVMDFHPVSKGLANQIQAPLRLRAIKTLRPDGVCESVLYGLPLLLQPTTCWKLDWDEMETNHNVFQALCSSLKSRDVFLLLRVEPPLGLAGKFSGVCSHYVLQPSACLSLLLKPVVPRELLLPCSPPTALKDPAPDALQTVQSCLNQLDEELLLNPLSLSCNLYEHLRSRVQLPGPQYPYRDQAQPLEGPKATHGRQPLQMAALRFQAVRERVDEQTPNQDRQLGPSSSSSSSSKVRATVAPFPSSSSSSSSPSFSSAIHPPAAKVPCVTTALLGSSKGRGHRQPLDRSRTTAAAAAARPHKW